MTEPTSTFSSAVSAWLEWRDSPWGRLGNTVVAANLDRHLAPWGPTPLRVLDLAGGDGSHVLPLAARGHHVTVVDYAPAMLAAARDRAAAAGVAERVTTVEADMTDLPASLLDAGYDVVLCHNFLQYVDDVTPALTAVAAAVRPGGLVSVLAANRHYAPLAAAVRDGDPGAALAALDSRRGWAEVFGTALTLHTAEEVIAVMAGLGCTGIRHYGVRSFCDHLAEDRREDDPGFHAAMERLELAVTDRPPYMHTARAFQLIARRHAG
ncbi:methyltransferase domain-containing protein [Streptomyces sp. ISL-11]|uniref:class I SAM-dependent methyltransferase n=1 Tax=Streptomyces sp. ISL-11 TaxID=2819174 RepID=UPI0027E3D796|nr:methyltransferase domain-containing protein [Streptomyces sp. ISL-11]